MNLVSAVITTHKREPDMLERALLSVLKQTYSNIEVIVIDDSPQDYPMRPLVAEMVKKYKDVIYIQHETCQGACAARNTGIKNSHGDYFAFLDDDDEWLPKKIEILLEKFTSDDIGLVYCANYIIKAGKAQIEPREWHRGNIFDQLVFKNFVGSTSFPLCSKKAILAAGMFDVDMPAAQDYDLWLRIAQQYKVEYVEDVLVNYYVHDGEQITKNFQKKAIASERILNKHMSYFEVHKKAYACWLLRISNFCAESDMKKAKKLWRKAFLLNPFDAKDLCRGLKRIMYVGTRKKGT